jgi:hypothetical protein
MSQALPVDGFRWLEKEEFEHLNINYVSDDSEDGYILEVDLDYPSELHDHHTEYPIAPEKMKVTEDMLSPYALSFLRIKIYIRLKPRLLFESHDSMDFSQFHP